MAIIREQQAPNDSRSWYPDNGVTNTTAALTLITKYFPDVLNARNTIGTDFLKASRVVLLPKYQRQAYEKFIAAAPIYASSNSPELRLRYYLSENRGRRSKHRWELQYDYGIPDPSLHFSWKGEMEQGSTEFYGNFIGQIDFRLYPENGNLFVRSIGDGAWMLNTSIYDPLLKEKLGEVSEQTAKARANILTGRTRVDSDSLMNQPFDYIMQLAREGSNQLRDKEMKRLVRINDMRFTHIARGNIILDISDYMGPSQVVIPTIVTPTRYV
jgi:hypothetical protein